MRKLNLRQTLVAVLMYYMGLQIKFISNYFGEARAAFGTAMCFIVTTLIVGIKIRSI